MIDDMPQSSGYPIQFGKYILQERIAVGGMAEIFRAVFRTIEGVEKQVALKRILPEYSLDEEFVALFVDEARLSATLQHPNIVQVFDFGKLDRSYYLAMEFVDGPNLKHFTRKLYQYENAFPIEFAIYIIIQLLKALDYLYRATDSSNRPLKVIHRDISPQNILLSREGEVKITDFGIAKAASKLSKTVPGKIQGKFGYMSPEQAMGKELDHRSDLFSLGIIFFEMLTGKRLYGGENTLIRYENVKEAKVQPVSKFRDVPEALDRIVAKMLQKEADDRYQSSSELQKDLSDFIYPANSETVISGLSQAINKYFPKEPSTSGRGDGAIETEKKPWWKRAKSSLAAKRSGNAIQLNRENNTITQQQPTATEEAITQNPPSLSLTPSDNPMAASAASLTPESGAVIAEGHTLIAPDEPGSKTGDSERTPSNQSRNVIEIYSRLNESRERNRTGKSGGMLRSIRKSLEPMHGGISRLLLIGVIILAMLLGVRLAGGGNWWIGDLLSPFTGKRLKDQIVTLEEEKASLTQKLEEKTKELELVQQQLTDLAEQKAQFDSQAGSSDKKLRDLEEQFNREQERWNLEKKTVMAQLEVVKAQLAEATSKCPKEMVYVGAGKFFFGSAEDDPERNLGEFKESLEQSKGYCIDAYEYPNTKGKPPKVGVTWQEALNTCESVGKRLCSEREWERACKGSKNNRYTYGNVWQDGACSTENKLARDGVLNDSGALTKCVSDLNVFDMSGNASEWTDIGGAAKANNPVLKGGSFDRAGYWSRCAARLESAPETKGASVGFRCCRDLR